MRQLKPKSLFGVPAIALCAIVGCLNAGWWQTFGGAERDEGTCVQQTSDGGYIVTGVTWSFGRPNESDIWLIKLDSAGHKEWEQTYATENIVSWGFSVRQTSDGSYIIAGSIIIKTDENGDTMWTRDYSSTARCIKITSDGNYIVAGKKSDVLWLMKISSNGDSLWAKTYVRGNNGCSARYIEQTKEGDYIVTGVWSEVDDEQQIGKLGGWLLKTDSLGDTIWTKDLGGEEWLDDDRGHCVRQTDDDGYIIAGSIGGYILTKTDSLGNIQWQSIPYGEGRCVQVTSDGSYIVTGGTETGTLTSMPVGGNLWLIKTDSNGDTIWTREYGDEETDAGRYVQQSTDSGYIVTGYTWSYGLGGGDLYLLKTDSLGLLGVKEDHFPDNPADWLIISSVGPSIILRYSDVPQGLYASVFDASGRKMDEIHSSSSSGSIVWGKEHPAGVYFIRVENTLNRTSIFKVLLVH